MKKSKNTKSANQRFIKRVIMDKKEFKKYRKRLQKTQKQMAELLGASLKAIHSYEQGWRSVPVHVERQLYFLLFRSEQKAKGKQPCWKVKKCNPEQRRRCPAWEFNSGDLCWLINGTVCEGAVQESWQEKIKICKSCQVFKPIL
jgi:DNA-binding XRE family transcriptional regulator